ncbi:DNA polymerase III subunit chi [Rhodoferax sp.]|uniref:DNA polymerase III subunit chi n=1 Tax=Rhodoferax sp. TaxID=50421 RepID=UPI00283D9635|nr:DNA polymerase III subunit chi [Rhodoferax sp.]MDR3369662.1 DNA polymerase III subunit chi [Rhodoferax sp.]
MTSVAFHFNVNDRLHYTCRLVRKAVAAGTSLVVNGPGAILERFDRELWTFSATEFVPHGHVGDATSLAHRSPVLLCESLDDAPVRDVLINLSENVPTGFEAFDRVIEVVSEDPVERGHARLRWKHYSKAGSELIHHDLSPRTPS